MGTMRLGWIEQPDDDDIAAGKHGLLMKSEAARALDCSPYYLNKMIERRDLETKVFAGRTFVTQVSVERQQWRNAEYAPIARAKAVMHRSGYVDPILAVGLEWMTTAGRPTEDIEKSIAEDQARQDRLDPGGAFLRKLNGGR